jgi:arylsulfatase A-like enzyme
LRDGAVWSQRAAGIFVRHSERTSSTSNARSIESLADSRMARTDVAVWICSIFEIPAKVHGMRLRGILVWIGLIGCNSSQIELAADPPTQQSPTEKPFAPRMADEHALDERPQGEQSGAMSPTFRSHEHATDAWLDLLAARPLATRTVQRRLIIDLSDPGAKIHLDPFGQREWKLGEAIDDVYAGAVIGRGATLDFPLDGLLSPLNHPDESDGSPGLALAITLRAAVPKQALTVFLNDRPLANLRLSEVFTRRTFSLPSNLVREGENRIRLHFSRTGVHGGETIAAWVTNVEIGSRRDIVLGSVDLARGRVKWMTSPSAAMVIPTGSSIAYYVVLPRRARIRLRTSGPGRLLMRVQAQAESQAKTQAPALFDLELGSVVARDHTLDLSGFAETPTRIELSASGLPEQQITIESLVVESPRSVPEFPRAKALRDVYIVSVEGLRADLVEDPSAWHVEVPNLRALITEGFWAPVAYAASSAAVPSHAAWLASTEPGGSWTVRGTYVAGARELIPEHLARSGYESLMVTMNSDVNDSRGLTQGFLRIVDARDLGRNSGNGRDWMRAALERARSLRSPRMVWVNLNDPQAPYEPASELVENFPASLQRLAESMPNRLWVERVRGGKFVPTAPQLEYVKRLYAAECVQMDRAIGDLVAAVKKEGRWDQSMIVVLGVHGEEFLEHGGAGHGRTLFEESIRVPLIIVAPGLMGATKARTPVSLVDLAPTLTELLGLAPSSQWQGQSMVRRFEDSEPPLGLSVAQQADGSRAFIVGPYKLVLPPAAALKPPQLYDLSVDPTESQDVAERRGFLLRMMRSAAVVLLADERVWKRARWGTPAALDPDYARDHGL